MQNAKRKRGKKMRGKKVRQAGATTKFRQALVSVVTSVPWVTNRLENI